MEQFTKDFDLDGKKITLTVQTSKQGDNIIVHTNEFRPFAFYSNPTKEDWIKETAFLFEELSQMPLTGLQDYQMALFHLCLSHIRQYGRLIDSDLFTYVDEILLVIKQLAILEGASFNKETGVSIWVVLKDHIFESLAPHIWVNNNGSLTTWIDYQNS